MKTQAQLEIENAELRGQNSTLREMLEKLMAKPPTVQHIPCPLPHYPPVQIVPQHPTWNPPIGPTFGPVFGPLHPSWTACAAPINGHYTQAAQTVVWNGPFPTANAQPQFGAYHMTVGGSS